MKKILSLLVIVGTILTFGTENTVFADEEKVDVDFNEVYENTGYLIEEKTTVLDDGTLMVEKLYCDTNTELLTAPSSSGSRPIKYEKSVSLGSGKQQTLAAVIWVSGDFTWDRDKDIATVANADGGYTFYGGYSYKSHELDSKSNQGFNFIWAHKYAYARYTLKFTSPFNDEHECSVYVDCNVNGVSSCA